MLRRSVAILLIVNIFSGCMATNSMPSPDYYRSYAAGATTDNVIGAIAIVSGATIIASIAYLTSRSNRR